MKARAHIDFETFSELDVTEVGSSRMAEHPSTRALCMGWAIGDDDPRVWVPSGPLADVRELLRGGLEHTRSAAKPAMSSQPPDRLFEHIAEGGLVCAWNAEFEIAFWEEVMVKRCGWPEVPRDQWRDTGANALSLSLPASLDLCGNALGLDTTKDRNGRRVMLKLCKPRNPSLHDPRTLWEVGHVPQDYIDLYDYCAADVWAERAVHQVLPIDELPPAELAIWQNTMEMNLRGWYVDAESAALMVELLERHKVKALEDLVAITGGYVTSGGQVEKIREWLRTRCALDLPDLRKDRVVATLADPNLGTVPRKVLQFRQALSKTSTAKYESIVARACNNGAIKNNIMYHGCSTGRDAARGTQTQNVPREVIAPTDEGVETAFRALRTPDPLATVQLLYNDVIPYYASAMIRHHFTARPGHTMYCADFSSIENRVAAWVSGCQYGIDIFNQGLDEYRTFGAKHYGVAYEDVTSAQRDHSKGAILLCVYGGGAKAMVAQADRHGSTMSLETAERTVDHYRTLYKEVKRMWYGLVRQSIKCVRSGGPTNYLRVGFRRAHDFLMVRLPSGREMAYYQPQVEMVPAPWGGKVEAVTFMGIQTIQGRTTTVWKRQHMSPGHTFQNVVQAIARDAMMHAALAVTEAGYPLVMRVHDELASERRLGEGSLEEYCKIMSTPPPWLDGINTDVTGWAGARYRKE